MVLVSALCWGIAQRRNNDLHQHFCRGESCPFHSRPKTRQFNSSQFVPGAFRPAAPVLELRESDLSSCLGPLRGIAWDSRSPSSHLATIPTGFYSQKFEGLPFLALDLGCEAWCGAGTSSLRRGNLFSWDIPPDFYLPHVGVGQLVLCLCPSSQFWCVFFYILSCRTSVQLDFRWSELWLFYSLVVILMLLWEVLSTAFSYTAILTGICPPLHIFFSFPFFTKSYFLNVSYHILSYS